MHLKRFHFFALWAAVSLPAAFRADGMQWSLKQCIDYALDHNIRIQGQRLETTYYQNRYRQSKADLLPEMSGGASQDFLFGRSVDLYTYQYQNKNVMSNQFYLNGHVTLFDGMRGVTTIRRDEVDLSASGKNAEYLRNEITMEVVEAYLTALYNREMIDAAARQLEVTRLQIGRTQVLVDAGSAPRGSLYELTALAAQEEVDLLRAGNQESISVLTLQQLLELDTVADFALLPPQLPEIGDTDVQAVLPDLYRSALSLPEVEAGELAIRSASLDLKIQKEKRLPTLTFDATLSTGYSDAYKRLQQVFGGPAPIGYLGSDPLEKVYAPSSRTEELDYPFGDQVRDNVNTRLSLQLNVPLFSRFQTTNAIDNAKFTVEQKKLDHETVKKEALRKVRIAFNDARAALREYHGNIRAREATRESFRYTEEKFNVGMVSSVDYHNGKNLLSKAESDLLQSKYRYFLKKFLLEVLCGKPVSINERK
jgi:outer membrane protein